MAIEIVNFPMINGDFSIASCMLSRGSPIIQFSHPIRGLAAYGASQLADGFRPGRWPRGDDGGMFGDLGVSINGVPHSWMVYKCL